MRVGYGRRAWVAAGVAAAAVGVVPPVTAPAAAAPGAWQPTIVSGRMHENVSAFADGTAYLALPRFRAGDHDVLPNMPFLKSTDFGQTWRPVTVPAPARAGELGNPSVRFGTPKVGYLTWPDRALAPRRSDGTIDARQCAMRSHTFRTDDGGASWQALCEPHARGYELILPTAAGLAVGRDGTVLQAGRGRRAPGTCDRNFPSAFLHLSSDRGRTWRGTMLPRGYAPRGSGQVHDRNTALVVAASIDVNEDCGPPVVADGGAVFLTRDGGRSWRRVLRCPATAACTTAAFVTARRIVVGRADGSTVVTADAGRRWVPGQRLYDPVNDAYAAASPVLLQYRWVQSMSFADSRHGYASTRGSGTWRTADGGRTWVQERSHDCVYNDDGWGEVVAITPDRAILAARVVSVRVPVAADTGGCRVAPVPVPARPITAPDGLVFHPDGRVTLAGAG